jgi:hypothetical protein
VAVISVILNDDDVKDRWRLFSKSLVLVVDDDNDDDDLEALAAVNAVRKQLLLLLLLPMPPPIFTLNGDNSDLILSAVTNAVQG